MYVPVVILISYSSMNVDRKLYVEIVRRKNGITGLYG